MRSLKNAFKELYGIFTDLHMPLGFKLRYLANRLLIYLHYLSFGLLPRVNLFPTETIEIKNGAGVWRINPKLGDGWVVSRYFEKDLEEYFRPTGNGELMLDIGAHIGKWSIRAARNGFQVTAFEPDPKNHQLLLDNIRLNQVQNRIRVVNLAISDQQATYYFQSDSGGLSRIVNAQGPNTIAVQAVSLDSYCQEQKIDAGQIAFIKMDIEGHELTAVKGMLEVLSKLPKGATLIIECDQAGEREIQKFFNSINISLVARRDVNSIFVKK